MAQPSQKIRTLILGGGPAALTCLHHLSPTLHPVCFSARPSLWTPTYDITAPPTDRPDTEVSPMYRSLSTNISKMLMRFTDLHMGAEVSLFPNRPDVERFLGEYEKMVVGRLGHGKRFERGIRVERVSWRGRGRGWDVTSRRIESGEGTMEWFSHVVVAGGNYSFPRAIPDTPGLEEWVEGGRLSVHSKYFRSPGQFVKDGRPKRILIVGGSASGLDISSHFGVAADEVVTKPVLRSVRSRSPERKDGNLGEKSGYWPGNHAIKEVGEIVRFNADGTVEFTTGEKESVDVVVWCIGYIFRRPELDLSGGLEPGEKLEDVTIESPGGERFKNLYNHTLFIPDPTLSFLGTPQKIVPFVITEAQAIYINAIWTSTIPRPPTSEMKQWEKTRLERKGEKAFHWMDGGEDGDYVDELRRLCNGDGVVWTKRDRWERGEAGRIRGEFVRVKVEEGRVVNTIEELGLEFEQAVVEAEKEGGDEKAEVGGKETEKIDQLI